MSARKEARGGKPTGRWYFRKQIQVDGNPRRIYGYPEDYGQPNTQAGALAAEAIAVARALAGETTAAGAAPAHVSPARVGGRVATVAEAADLWLVKSRADDKPGSLRAKLSSLRKHVLPQFGSLPLDELTAAKLEEWRLHLVDTLELELSTVAHHFKILKSIVRYARLRGLMRGDLPQFPRFRGAALPPRYLSTDESRRLILAADGMEPWRDMIVVALRTGLRIGELSALRWLEVDLARGVLHVARNWTCGQLVTPKSGKSRIVPLSRDALTVLRHRRGHAAPEALVFPTPGGSGFISYGIAYSALHEICRRAGLAPFAWHRLRHTFATQLVMRGINPRTIQELLGHSDIQTTMRYMHALPAVSQAAVNALDGDDPSHASSAITSAHTSAT